LTLSGTAVGTQKTNFFGEFKFDGLAGGVYTLDIDASGKKYTCEVTITDESKNLGFIRL